MFLSHDDFMWVIKTCVDISLIEKIFKERRNIIRSTISGIATVNDKISGFSYSQPVKNIDMEPETTTKSK